MAIRIIVRTDDAAMAANVGGSVETTFRTFDCDLPELERFLEANEPAHPNQTRYSHRQIVGAELIRTANPTPQDTLRQDEGR